jgi:hypothetical protein
VRIHHYILLFFSIFVDDEFQKGVLEGAGLEDLPDLLDDYASLLTNKGEQAKLRNLANQLRKQQGKTKN